MTEPPSDRDTDASGRGTGPDSPPGAPAWAKAFGIVLLTLLLLAVGLVVFGGGQHGPWRHAPGGGPGVGDTPEPLVGAPTGEAGARPQPDAGAPAAANEATRTIEVAALDAPAFEPSAVEASAGEVITFVITNTGQRVHEFTLGDAAMQQERATMMGHMPPGVSHDLPNSVTLQPGETRRLTWRFGGTGALEYGCHVEGHYQAGMRGRIAVE